MWMANFIGWPEGSRLAGMAGTPRGSNPGKDGIVAFHLVDLADGQQGSEEMSMAHAHLPFAGTSIHGTYPDGLEWMLLTQVAAIDATQGFLTSEQAVATFHDHFQRYLRLNPEATVVTEVTMSRLELLLGYQERDVFVSDLVNWGVGELLAGMVCEMCNVELRDVVNGHESGCTFPDMDHYCTGNGFTDVFAQWSRGLLARLDVADDSEDYEEDDALRHVTLESYRSLLSEDWSVSAIWTEGVLYIAHCNYGDGPDTTWGMDIDDPMALLTWMLRDRFVESHWDFMQYVDREGLAHSSWLAIRESDMSEADTIPIGFSVRESADLSAMVFLRSGSELDVCRVADSRALTLALLRDRCQGTGAWDAVSALLNRAGISATPSDRGFF